MTSDESEIDARLSALEVEVPEPRGVPRPRGRSRWLVAAVAGLSAGVAIVVGVALLGALNERGGSPAVTSVPDEDEAAQRSATEITFSFPDGTSGGVSLPRIIPIVGIEVTPELWIRLAGEGAPGVEHTPIYFYRGDLSPFVEIEESQPVGPADLVRGRIIGPSAGGAGASGETASGLVWTVGEWTVVLRTDSSITPELGPEELVATLTVELSPEGWPVVSSTSDAVQVAPPDRPPRMHFSVSTGRDPVDGGLVGFILTLSGCDGTGSTVDGFSACHQGSTTRLTVRAQEPERSLLLDEARWWP